MAKQNCCGPSSSVEDELTDLADDPSLLDCCRRDLKQQARSAALVSRLRDVDVTSARTKEVSKVLKCQPQPCDEEHGDLSSASELLETDEEDEDDP
eukprot:scaffold157935_cov37-Prasinocladus_malaysianus.AAC.1